MFVKSKANIISSFSVTFHVAASTVGDGVGRVQTGGGLQDCALHTVVALHSRPSHALRLEKGSVYLFSFCTFTFLAIRSTGFIN
jgi:hypothetical protein